MVFVFEGPDDVGKTTIVSAVQERLTAGGQSVLALSFPGRIDGSLGAHVHRLHHRPEQFAVRSITPDALQVLHISAHLDNIERHIRPHASSGGIVLLDRYWWSTWVYGRIGGVSATALELMVDLERHYWRGIEPRAVFLISRSADHLSASRKSAFLRETEEYRALAEQQRDAKVIQLSNDRSVADIASRVAEDIRSLVEGLPGDSSAKGSILRGSI